jgi:hypothetical protein
VKARHGKPSIIASAWADETGLVPGQVQTKEKSNEITATPALLEALDISGCIVMYMRQTVVHMHLVRDRM